MNEKKKSGAMRSDGPQRMVCLRMKALRTIGWSVPIVTKEGMSVDAARPVQDQRGPPAKSQVAPGDLLLGLDAVQVVGDHVSVPPAASIRPAARVARRRRRPATRFR